MSGMSCKGCGLPIFQGAYGYVGPVCQCAGYGFPRYAVYPSEQKEDRRYGPLTEQDVRRIVREELEKKEGRDA